jgi:hypothetical protein
VNYASDLDYAGDFTYVGDLDYGRGLIRANTVNTLTKAIFINGRVCSMSIGPRVGRNRVVFDIPRGSKVRLMGHFREAVRIFG